MSTGNVDGRSLRTNYWASGSHQKKKTHCPLGHEYSIANTYHDKDGHRVCRKCAQLRMQRRRENPECKAQGAAAAARWRERNPEKNREGWQRSHQEKKQILLDARIGGCVVCGEKHPSCLDFHHRNGLTDKLGNIGEIRRFSKKRILAEIAKCDVLCSNCHRKHHYEIRSEKREACQS